MGPGRSVTENDVGGSKAVARSQHWGGQNLLGSLRVRPRELFFRMYLFLYLVSCRSISHLYFIHIFISKYLWGHFDQIWILGGGCVSPNIYYDYGTGPEWLPVLLWRFYFDFKCIHYARLVYYFVMHRTYQGIYNLLKEHYYYCNDFFHINCYWNQNIYLVLYINQWE